MSRVRTSVQPLKGPTTEKVAARFENAVAAALYQTGTVILRNAMKITPVQYGVLRRSGYVAPPVAGLVGPTVEVGFGTKYALYVHDGWEKLDGTRVPGRPYLRPAFEEVVARGPGPIRDLALKLYKRGVGASIIGGGGEGGGFPTTPPDSEAVSGRRKEAHDEAVATRKVHRMVAREKRREKRDKARLQKSWNKAAKKAAKRAQERQLRGKR